MSEREAVEGGTAEAPEPSFSEAMEQLETILRGIEAEEVDIDELAEQLKRATVLLELCRAKIRKAEVEVSQVVRSLEQPDAVAGPEGD
jgi:exodeoxyribonuclease VII small subunit